MSERISKFTTSLRQLGEIQVTDWDFMSLLNKDVGELEVSRSLKKLGNLKVMDLDFNCSLPAVNKLANQEVDFVDLVRRAAHYKVMEWDFKTVPPAGEKPANPFESGPGHAEMQALIVRLRKFLQYVAANLIDDPEHARIGIEEIESNVLRFKLVLVSRDVAMLIGREGHTASAIRGIMKSVAAVHGVHVLLHILSHEEEMAEAKP